MTTPAHTSIERLAHDWATRQLWLSERLASAFSAQFGGCQWISRRDARDRCCEYPARLDHVVDIDSAPGLREERDALAAEYYSLTDIAPSKCMVVWWVEELTLRVEYERRPEEW